MLRREAIQSVFGGAFAPLVPLAIQKKPQKKFDSFLRMYRQNDSCNNFPLDDALTLQQRSGGCCNLHLYYPYQFIQDEVHENICVKGLGSGFYTNNTPILAGSMTGTICFDDFVICKFYDFIDSQKFDFQKYNWLDSNMEFEFSGQIDNHHTGQFSFKWNKIPFAPNNIRVVVSYEYNMECQYVSPILPTFFPTVGVHLDEYFKDFQIKVSSLDNRVIKKFNLGTTKESFLSEMNALVLPSDGFKFVLDEEYIKAVES